MTTSVDFTPGGDCYAVQFDYDPGLVALIKTLPSFARRWWPEYPAWVVASEHADWLADELGARGCHVTGLDGHWARLLFRRVGPDRAAAVRSALADVLHPGNPGDEGLFHELCDAYEAHRRTWDRVPDPPAGAWSR